MNERDFRNVKNRIFYKLVNTNLNQVAMDNAPNVKIPEFGMSKLFYVYLDEDEMGATALFVNNPIADILGYSVEELEYYADKNTFRLFPTVMKSLKDIMSELLGMSADTFINEEFDIDLYVLSNSFKTDGAHAMFNREFLDSFAERNSEKRLYLLPVSKHEVFVVLGSHIECERDLLKLKSLLYDLVSSDDIYDERLGYECIIYDVETGEYSVA